LLREGPFKDVWIQPAAGDAGGAIGAALARWHEDLNQPRRITGGDQMRGGFLGPQYTSHEVETTLNSLNAHFEILDDDTLCDQVARLLATGKVIGWISGRMEFGPRALGARSILGDPRNPQMQFIMNHKIKFRESFRPFAPAVLCDAATDYFELDRPSPYMLLVAPVRPEVRVADAEVGFSGLQRVHEVRSLIPAVTHVDYSARVQTVHPDIHSRLHALLTRFRAHTGCAVLINTSFNVRGEPIVCTPLDAYRCFMKTDIDYLVVENCLLDKSRQPAENVDRESHAQIALD